MRLSTFVREIAVLALAAGTFVTPAPAAERACDDLLPPTREAKGQKVGPSSCLLTETELSVDGAPVRRLDIGLDGTVEGYVTEGKGDYRDYLTNAPALQFGNTGDPGPILHAVARYERDKGAAMTLLFPPREKWNGKLWVTAHGRGRSVKSGNLRAWNRNLDPADPAADLNRYDRLWLAKGYAVARTHRTSEQGIGEISSTLENGKVSMDKAFNDSARYVMDFTLVAEKALAARLGRTPARTYFYGHSAGARIGRGINYTPGLNVRADGKPFFHGIIADDAAAGTWLPVVMENGRDVLFAADPQRAAFVPQIDVSHQMYNNVWETGAKVDFMSTSYLENKRRNARILRDKGLGAKHRMYEVRGISHSGGESLPGGRKGDVQILDLSRAMDRFIDILDAWVETGAEPPATRSDWRELGDTDRDGIVDRPALAFPEIACPLGVYFPYPPSNKDAIAQTSWAPFTGQGLEPRDGRGIFVDMNRNGVWDFRETPTEAWRRLGLLAPGKTLTREDYTGCVRKAAEQLRADGFFSASTVARYAEEAAAASLEPAAR